MPNALTATGLQTATQAELVATYTAALQNIYGAGINLASNSPDGQWMNLFIQSVLDLEDLLVQLYNMFDPDNAVGVVLDQRVAINGIQRLAGTFTVTPVTLVIASSVNLFGLDQSTQPVYTVSDNAGNLWQLISTVLGVVAGTHVYNFQAAVPGAQITTPNTITVPVTIILGVTSVNNPTPYTTLGINEESDARLKLRRQQSVAIASQGYLTGLVATLENITGVTSVFVSENTTSVTNGDGVPGHSIWVIVAGTGAAADIAQAIYSKRNAGCGMFGSISFNITQIDGNIFPVYWDLVSPRNAFMTFTATSLNGTTAPNLAAIRSMLPSIFVPAVQAEINVNELATLVQQIDPNCLVTGAGLTLGRTQVAALSGVAASGTFMVSYAGANSAAINWNDSIGTIQTKVQAVSGLSAATVTGSVASQSLTFNLADGVQSLLTIVSNSLLTGGAAPIAFAFNDGYGNTLNPPSKKNQLLVTSADIIILPMILSPPSGAIVVHATTFQFTGLGGYGPYAYVVTINNSGGSINAATGLYTAGAVVSVTDTLTVTDAFGNTATATVSVT